ncbi:HNH endonuclease [Brevibacterium casei]|uniref:HNH endonuclease n=1 Tax=Brevibacterium casei TaxID=33889 RepID=A0A7T4DJW2_9MICO|nr:HNH endonuclease [Brevibacterium casei]
MPVTDTTESVPSGAQPGRNSRRINVDPDSRFAAAVDVYSACDRAQLTALETTAALFHDEVIDHLNLMNPDADEPYRHASLTETARRFARARTRDDQADTASDSPKVPSERDDGEASDTAVLPGFPRFRETQSIDGWVHAHSHAEDIAELATILGNSITTTYTHITTAMLLIHGLPKFHERCLAGDFTYAHVVAAARLCKDIGFAHLPEIDCYLARRRADVTIETFRKSLAMKISVVEPVEERSERAFDHRRVDLTTHPDGTSCLTITGPSAELQACFLRIEAFAKAIRNNSTAPFADMLPSGAVIEDDRTIMALMFDIFTQTRPQVGIEVRAHDTDTGEVTTREIPFDTEHVRSVADIADALTAAADRFEEAVDVDRDEEGRPLLGLNLSLPTTGFWFANQARMIMTVPLMSLLDQSELPGTFSDGSPVPADMARRVAGHCSTWSRILTDPATGTPVDAQAKSYYIPQTVRQTLIAQWQSCTVPGCRRRAESSEVDHIIPFDHDDPEHGGLTVFGNLHPLCKSHHQAKTDRKYAVWMESAGLLRYRFAHGVSAILVAGDNPVNVEHARQFATVEPPPEPPPESPPAPPPELPPPPEPPPPEQSLPESGDTRISDDCPGPQGEIGRPGWVKRMGIVRRPASPQQEWVWDNGEPPPF